MLYLFNTLSKTKELFIPIDKNHIKMYVCGPTVYDYIHIGNARPIVVFDTLYRLLNHLYPKVSYARNITDVDDKIITKALQNKEDPLVLTQRTIIAFHEDIKKINALPPTFEPKATDYIAKMIEMIQQLINLGHAYVANKHVYFDVKSYPLYGKLSGISQEEILNGARVEVSEFKRNPSDFVLWKPSLKSDNCGWDSPWGYGRVGWHIECSAMSRDLLGENFDIHGGGKDLIFPHHENEIAQSVCCSPQKDLSEIEVHSSINTKITSSLSHEIISKENHQEASTSTQKDLSETIQNNTLDKSSNRDSFMANYWLHNDFVVVDGHKMSKSLGNFITLNEVLKEYHGEVVRLTLLKTHYRSPLDFSKKSIQDSQDTLDKLYNFLLEVQDIAEKDENKKPNEEFLSALCDDLNTHLAISVLYKMLNEVKNNPDSTSKIKSQIIASANMLGLLYENPQTWFTLKSKKLTISEEEIMQLLEQRKLAKKNKDFQEADKIRDYLNNLGIIIEDSSAGVTWRIK